MPGFAAAQIDEDYHGKPVRIVALHLPLETGKSDSMVLVQVAENRGARYERAATRRSRCCLMMLSAFSGSRLSVFSGHRLSNSPPKPSEQM